MADEGTTLYPNTVELAPLVEGDNPVVLPIHEVAVLLHPEVIGLRLGVALASGQEVPVSVSMAPENWRAWAVEILAAVEAVKADDWREQAQANLAAPFSLGKH